VYTFLKLGLFAGVLAALGGSLAQTVKADSFTLQGAFTRDGQAALFDVVLNASSSVDIRSYGYTRGTTSTGIPIPQGGFHPVLTLFSSSGAFIADNDEGADTPADIASGQSSDARLQVHMNPGTYVVALTQYDNFSIGQLSDGFLSDGQPHFTSDPGFSPFGPCPGNTFRDISSGRWRNGNWALDFVNGKAKGSTL
jgi:hypothetical protein